MRILKLAWVALILIHSCIIFANIASFFFLIFCAPWFISFPCCTLIARIVFNDTKCPLTALENELRKRIGWPQIDKFVEHYFLKWINWR